MSLRKAFARPNRILSRAGNVQYVGEVHPQGQRKNSKNETSRRGQSICIQAVDSKKIEVLCIVSMKYV